jgi:hypothetical protein
MRSKSTFSLQFASLDSWRNWGGAREERVVRVMREGERDRERERQRERETRGGGGGEQEREISGLRH